LATCSKCGTQFIHPKKFCDLCGAPFILEEVPDSEDDELPETGSDELPEADSSGEPESDEEELAGAAEEELPEPAEEEIPESDADETDEPYADEQLEAAADEEPESDEEEPSEKVSQKMPGRHKDDEPEPDTAKLLEQFGAEYSDDETLESFHTAKPMSPVQPRAKKAVTIATPQRPEQSKPVDDVLFLVDGGPTPAKIPVNKIWIIGGGIGMVIILAVIFFIGLPLITGLGEFTTNNNPASPEITSVPVITTPEVILTPVSGALVPQPTQTPPAGQKIYFQVRKDPITYKISIIFTGSAGTGSITSADVKVTHPDGSVTGGVILPLKGLNDISLIGSKEPDRVEIIAKMSTGETYRFYDNLVTS
jgi:hypothetical protein